MRRVYIKAFNSLKKMGVPVYQHAEDAGRFSISVEDASSYLWATYYPEHNQWNGENTNPKMDAVLNNAGLYAEWVNPGRLSVYEI